MNIYSLQKINQLVKLNFVKNIGFWLFHVLNKKYLAIYLDPVLSCNLRCLSCYFSNDEIRKTLNGTFKEEDLARIAQAIFGRALRLQIGCGAEPTLYKHNPKIIQLGKEYGIQHVSLTTNANLLTEEMIKSYLAAGLDEMTISIHGVKKETYEHLMNKASFSKLLEVLEIIAREKKKYPKFILRLNYTINNQNVNELKELFDVYGKYDMNILQLRALRNIGGEIKSVDTDINFNKMMQEAVQLLKKQCKENAVTFINHKEFVANEDEVEDKYMESPSYCYISAKSFWEDDFNWREETFNEYSKRTNYSSKLFKRIFNKQLKLTTAQSI
jgi:molybdenum cofactor biosynthesis enzyme MoaA